MSVNKIDYRKNTTLLRIIKALFIGIYFSVLSYLFKKSAKSERKTDTVIARKMRVCVYSCGYIILLKYEQIL